MLNIDDIKKNKDTVVAKLVSRGLVDVEPMIDAILVCNEARKREQLATESLAATLKKRAQRIALLMKEQLLEEADRIKALVAEEKKDYKKALGRLKEYEKDLLERISDLPNLPADDVPQGRDAKDNKVVASWSPAGSMAEGLPHWDLVEVYRLIDFSLGNKVTGAGFPVYQGDMAKLQRGLIAFFLDKAAEAGYEERGLPLIVNKASVFGTGQLPDKEGMMYALQEPGMYLIPTAEVPLTNLYRDAILPVAELPCKVVAYTPCFRREAGSWGRHVRGLNRLHQFDKVELVQVTTPEKSREVLSSMCDHVAMLLQALQLPYRILQLCTGDLGATSSITYDFEVWSAGQQQWLEVSSVSSFSSYQARRLNLRYRAGNKKGYCHTLNGSGLALPRVLAALLENNQSEEGIAIPSALHAYVGFEKISKPVA